MEVPRPKLLVHLAYTALFTQSVLSREEEEESSEFVVTMHRNSTHTGDIHMMLASVLLLCVVPFTQNAKSFSRLCRLECNGYLRSWPKVEFGFNEGPRGCEFCACVGEDELVCRTMHPKSGCQIRECPPPEPPPYCRHDPMCGPNKPCTEGTTCVLVSDTATLGCCHRTWPLHIDGICKTSLFDRSAECPPDTACVSTANGYYRCKAMSDARPCAGMPPCRSSADCTDRLVCYDNPDDTCDPGNSMEACPGCCLDPVSCGPDGDCSDLPGTMCRPGSDQNGCTSEGTCVQYGPVRSYCRDYGIPCERVMCHPHLKCIANVCTVADVCCDSTPVCPIGTVQDDCSIQEEKDGVCRVLSQCCETIMCRKAQTCEYEGVVYTQGDQWTTTMCQTCTCTENGAACVSGCPADKDCYPEVAPGGCSGVMSCKSRGQLNDECVESGLECERRHCATGLLCVVQGNTNVGVCLDNTVCCQAEPSCGRNGLPDDTCSHAELASGACTAVSGCCRAVTCRPPQCNYEGGVYPYGAVEVFGCTTCQCKNEGKMVCNGCAADELCQKAIGMNEDCLWGVRSCRKKRAEGEVCRDVGDDCHLMPCQNGLKCIVTTEGSLEGVCQRDAVCCEAAPVCPGNMPPATCSEMDILNDVCRIVNGCCTAITCRMLL